MACLAHKILVFVVAAVVTASVTLAGPAWAKDGGGGGGGGHGTGGGGSSGSGSNSGNGSDDGGGSRREGDEGDTGNDGSGPDDYNQARDAVRTGQVLPLKSVLRSLNASQYGHVIDVGFIRGPARDTYILKFRDQNGAIHVLRVDARDGALLSRE